MQLGSGHTPNTTRAYSICIDSFRSVLLDVNSLEIASTGHVWSSQSWDLWAEIMFSPEIVVVPSTLDFKEYAIGYIGCSTMGHPDPADDTVITADLRDPWLPHRAEVPVIIHARLPGSSIVFVHRYSHRAYYYRPPLHMVLYHDSMQCLRKSVESYDRGSTSFFVALDKI